MTVGRAAREDFSLFECAQRLNGPHCPHLFRESLRSNDMICCWCGHGWSEPHATDFDHHGTYAPGSKPARVDQGNH